MKTFISNLSKKIIIIIAVFATYNSYSQVTPEDPTSLTQEFVVNIDKVGNATLELTQKMNGQQWENFKSSPIYSDPSISKRDLERSMSAYVVDDFKRDVDDMNRSVKLTVKVRSYAQYKGNGQWSLKIDAKNPQVTKLTDKSYMMTGNSAMGQMIVQQIYKINFPSNASDVVQTTDEFGKAIFSYNAGAGFTSYLKWNNIVGILLILAALYFVIQPGIATRKFNTVKA